MITRIFKEYDFGDGLKKYLAISYSQLEVFLNCPYRWFKYYLLGEGEPSSTESTELGTAIHSSIEEFCQAKQEGKVWEIGEAIELVETKLKNRKITFEPSTDKQIVEQHLHMAVDLVQGENALGKLLKQCDVLAQELEFKLRFKLPFDVLYKGEAYNEVVLNGFIDLLLKDNKTGEIIVIDHKTSKKMFDNDKLHFNYQLPIYQLVILQLYGRLPSRCLYYFTRFNEFQEVTPLVLKDEDSKVLTYYKSGRNKGKPKYIRKSVNMIERELIDIFKQMYAPKSLENYASKPTALCSWCTFGRYDMNTCKFQKKPPYIRKDIKIPKKNVKKIRRA
nr:MAG TPA: PD-(D/E)XK nuclease superfamily protein [Bacteriophage sp.]